MKLRKVSTWFSTVVLISLIGNGVLMLLIWQAHKSVVASQEYRQKAMTLTTGLQHETEQLTRLVRAFTTTGEVRYLFYYYDIMAIRRGEKPLPSGFNPITYWDEAIAGRIEHRLPEGGGKLSVADRMTAMGFRSDEFSALQKVLAATEAINQIDQIAFAATQGLYDPKLREFVSDGKPQLAFASQLVHSKDYNLRKADLSQAVQGLIGITDQRTNAEITKATNQLERLILLSIACLVCGVCLIVMASRTIRLKVLKPVQLLSEAADRLGGGDYATRVVEVEPGGHGTPFFDHRSRIQGVSELQSLGKTFDGMAQAIQDDIRARAGVQKELEIARGLAEAATHAKSMFLANMSHEIRTPMNAIIGMTYLALKTELTPRQLDYVGKAHSAARSLLGIINDILDFSKVEAGKLELEKANFKLTDVISNSLSLLRQRAQEKEIELLLSVEDPLLLGDHFSLKGDAMRLGQVLTNLLSNAVKFTQQGFVKLSVSVSERSLDSIVLCFSVCDTGIGLTLSQIDHLFQEFSQADGSTTRKFGGTGLGLAISQRLVLLMGGRIEVKSTPDTGSDFVFTARFEISQEAHVDEPLLSGVAHLRVLVVDDQLEAATVLAEMLGAMGVGAQHPESITTSVSGAAALQAVADARAANRPYDILFVDWVMPDMDGGMVLNKIQAAGGNAHKMLSVIVSAYDSDLIHGEARGLGVSEFLPKPVLPNELCALLNRLMGNVDADARHTDTSHARANLAGMRVLLVEDNLLNQQLAMELLKSEGLQVDIASDGREAVDRLMVCAADYYHAVLMDLQMPVMDGYEATRLLRLEPRFASLPIVAMTAHAMTDERERCEAIGMNGHIGKPIDPDFLYATLARFYLHDSLVRDVPDTAVHDAPLPNIVGVDTAVGLRHCGGKVPLYLSLLAGFAKDYMQAPGSFERLINDREWQAAERLAHTLKGMAATLGAGQLSEMCKNLEAACKACSEAPARETLPGLSQLLTSLLEAIHLATANSESATQMPTPEVSGALPTCLPQLQQLLADSDGDSIELWASHKQAFAGYLPVQTLIQISTALENIDFDRALELLNAGIPRDNEANSSL